MAATQDDPNNTFRFFDLAAELRNRIYDESLVTVSTTLSCKLGLKAENIPTTELLLVSRQFKREYEDRARMSKAKLTLLDNMSFHPMDDTPKLPSAAAKLSFLHLKLMAPANHSLWTKEVALQLPQLTTLTVLMVFKPGFPCYFPCYNEKFIDSLKRKGYENLPRLQEFVLYCGGKPGEEVPEVFDLTDMRKVLEFCPDKRCFERAKAVGGSVEGED